MCKKCVKKWAGIGNKMNEHFEEGFHHAVMRDMMTIDEEGMFYLFCYECAACGLDDAMEVIMMNEMFNELLEAFQKAIGV